MSSVRHDANAQRFTLERDGDVGVLDYSVSDGAMIITHTGVPPAIAGRGVAAELMGAAVAAARAAGWSVTPACSYAAAYLDRHPPVDDPTEAIAHREALLDEALDESYPASDPPSVGQVD